MGCPKQRGAWLRLEVVWAWCQSCPCLVAVMRWMVEEGLLVGLVCQSWAELPAGVVILALELVLTCCDGRLCWVL